jgi:hypothetical protein
MNPKPGPTNVISKSDPACAAPPPTPHTDTWGVVAPCVTLRHHCSLTMRCALSRNSQPKPLLKRSTTARPTGVPVRVCVGGGAVMGEGVRVDSFGLLPPPTRVHGWMYSHLLLVFHARKVEYLERAKERERDKERKRQRKIVRSHVCNIDGQGKHTHTRTHPHTPE